MVTEAMGVSKIAQGGSINKGPCQEGKDISGAAEGPG